MEKVKKIGQVRNVKSITFAFGQLQSGLQLGHCSFLSLNSSDKGIAHNGLCYWDIFQSNNVTEDSDQLAGFFSKKAE